LLHCGLRDRLAGCAPGEWNLYRCATCGTGYLDPRPNLATIALAYSCYFNYGSGSNVGRPRSAWRQHRQAQRNAYLNTQYGYQIAPATARSPRWLSQTRRQRFDDYVAYLHYPGKGARLLDVGCSTGGFLRQMHEAGWEVCGVEPDPKAAAEAAAGGLDVRVGMLETVSLPESHFDAVTLHHVIEHLHDPVGTLRLCRRVLKPGGTISIATPNLEAGGHRRFGSDWFPLEPPRHLVLFTPASLTRALELADFEPESGIRLRLVAPEMFRRSIYLQCGGGLIRDRRALPLSAKLKAAWLAWQADRATRAKPELAEELVLLARRPERTSNP
jgi:2-polyprenyl-3-methyl-5-hydroxy-6-metoxy-1,4-benzoquinol methylase